MTIKHFSKWCRYHLLFHNLARLPLTLAYRGSELIAGHDYRHRHDARRAIAQGLCRAFPAETAQAGVLQRWLQRYFAMMARETLDTFVMAQAVPVTLQRLVTVAAGSLQRLRQARGDGRGVIVIVNHYNRVNLLLLALALAGEQLGMLTGTVDQRNPELDPVERRYLGFKAATLHRYIGGPWVMLADSLRPLYRHLQQGGILAMALDVYNPAMRIERVQLPFLGGGLAVSPGIARIAECTGARLLYGVVQEHGWRAEVGLRPLPDQPLSALRGALQELERDVLTAPWQWWQWSVLAQFWQADERLGLAA